MTCRLDTTNLFFCSISFFLYSLLIAFRCCQHVKHDFEICLDVGGGVVFIGGGEMVNKGG